MSDPTPTESFRDLAVAVRETSGIIEAAHHSLQSPILSQADAEAHRVRFLRFFGSLLGELGRLETSLETAAEATKGAA